jgi:hypothetical protein
MTKRRHRNTFAKKHGDVVVKVVPRKEIDVDKLATALLSIAESLPKEEQERLAKDGAKISKRLGLFDDKKKAA